MKMIASQAVKTTSRLPRSRYRKRVRAAQHVSIAVDVGPGRVIEVSKDVERGVGRIMEAESSHGIPPAVIRGAHPGVKLDLPART